MNHTRGDTPLACQRTGGAFTTEQQKRYRAIRQQLELAVEGSQELPDGYAFRFPMETALIATLAEFINLERLCCPFFHFALEVEPGDGPLWLRLTGPEGVKELLQSEFDPDRLPRSESHRA